MGKIDILSYQQGKSGNPAATCKDIDTFSFLLGKAMGGGKPTPAPGVLDGTSWRLPKNKSWSAFGTNIKNYFMNFTFYTDALQTTPEDTVFTDFFINASVATNQIARSTQYEIACLSDDAYDVNATGYHAPQITAGTREWTIGKYGFGYNKNMDRYITFINGEDSNNEELIGWLNTYCVKI